MVGKKTIAKLRLYTAIGIYESNYCNKNLYCSGKCLALLSALMVTAVCHDSNVPLCRKFARSMTLQIALIYSYSCI